MSIIVKEGIIATIIIIRNSETKGENHNAENQKDHQKSLGESLSQQPMHTNLQHGQVEKDFEPMGLGTNQYKSQKITFCPKSKDLIIFSVICTSCALFIMIGFYTIFRQDKQEIKLATNQPLETMGKMSESINESCHGCCNEACFCKEISNLYEFLLQPPVEEASTPDDCPSFADHLPSEYNSQDAIDCMTKPWWMWKSK